MGSEMGECALVKTVTDDMQKKNSKHVDLADLSVLNHCWSTVGRFYYSLRS